MVAGPELAKVIGEFEDICLDGGAGKTTKTNLKHHEHTASAQVKFTTEVGALVQVLEDMGNPFMEESEDLLVLHSRDVADPAIVQIVREIEKTGQDQYDQYMTEQVIERTTPVFDPSKIKQTITYLKSDCTLFSGLYIATQTRDGDFDNFFKHENHAYPPSLSLLGKLQFRTKSDLVECLEKLCTSCGEAPVADVIKFQDYATHVFLPFNKAQVRNVTRIDIIWDVYLEDSLKSTFQHNPRYMADNKTELFDFLAHQVVENLSGEKHV